MPPTSGTLAAQLAYYEQYRIWNEPSNGSQYARWMILSLKLAAVADTSVPSPLTAELSAMVEAGHPAAMRLMIHYIRTRQFGFRDQGEADRLVQALRKRIKPAVDRPEVPLPTIASLIPRYQIILLGVLLGVLGWLRLKACRLGRAKAP